MRSFRTLTGVAGCVLLGLPICASVSADPALRTGSKVVSESTLLEKTPAGREFRRIRTEYHWDDGLVYHYVYDKAGSLVDTRISYKGLRPDAQELARVFSLVWEDPQVRSIRGRQAGLEVNGGFTFQEKTGACARPARCIQVFLFDGENVVKHMLVDLRTDKIVNYDYVPPRNRGAIQ